MVVERVSVIKTKPSGNKAVMWKEEALVWE